MKIDNYKFGSITIGGRTYTSDVIISPEEVDSSWWRETGHAVSIPDLEPILHRNPQIVIIGTGANDIMKVLPEARSELEEQCEVVNVLPTPQAVEKYNALAAENDKRCSREKGHFRNECFFMTYPPPSKFPTNSL